MTGALVALLPVELSADWLVTRDGERIETRGAWEEKGKLLVFKLADGTLSSIRLDNVDLEASREATARALEPPAAPEPKTEKKRESVLVITDRDVRHVDPEDFTPPGEDGAGTAAGADGEGDASADEGPGDGPRQVGANSDIVTVESWDWQRTDDPEGIQVSGQLTNGGDYVAANVMLSIMLQNDAGGLVARGSAQVDRTVLRPTESSGFRALFPGIVDFATVRFAVDSFNLETRQQAEAAAAADDG